MRVLSRVGGGVAGGPRGRPWGLSVLAALVLHAVLLQALQHPDGTPSAVLPSPGPAPAHGPVLLLAPRPVTPAQDATPPAMGAAPPQAQAAALAKTAVAAEPPDAATGVAAQADTRSNLSGETSPAPSAHTSTDPSTDPSTDTAADAPAHVAAPSAQALSALPRYAVDLPADFVLRLSGQRNGQPIDGEWVFERSAEPSEPSHFRSSMHLHHRGRTWLRWNSAGPLRSHGVQPERFEDHRRGRRSAAELDHGRGQVTYSGRADAGDVSPLAQDRLSWMLQLMAAVRADPALQGPGAELQLQVVGARGAAPIWRFKREGPEDLHSPAGERIAGALRFVREPEWPYDNRIDIWLDPQQGFSLARLRLMQVPGGSVWELWAHRP